jgi:glycerophosphoryl diester phosphodiesterase
MQMSGAGLGSSRLRRVPGARPIVLGHRGARRRAPENTLAAFELAMLDGADGVELDVRLDGSGRVIVLHDAGLDRVTGGQNGRLVAELTSAEIDGVRVFSGERIPLLSEVLSWAAERQALVNVELKGDAVDLRALAGAVMDEARRGPAPPERVFFSSFHPRLVRALAAGLPDHCTGWLVHERQRAFHAAALFWALGARAVHPEYPLLTDRRLGAWHHAGAVVNCWTVNELAEARRLSELGVDGIITDRPGEIVAAL